MINSEISRKSGFLIVSAKVVIRHRLWNCQLL